MRRDLVNVGTNRWSAPMEVGFSKIVRQWTFELALAGTLYQANDDFRGGRTRKQDPIYALQAHAVRSLPLRCLDRRDSTHYRGGRTVTDGLPNPNRQ